jgi:hypothetical protein
MFVNPPSTRPPRRNPARLLLAIAAVFGLGLVAPATSAAFSIFGGASSDGSKVFFVTDEQQASGDTDSSLDVYERSEGTTTLVSQGDIGGNGAFAAFFVGASSDGSKVFFHTNEQLVSGDTDSSQDIYERSGGTTTWVSQGVDQGGSGPFDAGFVGASSDGSKVFFQTEEPLDSDDTNPFQDVYERSGGTTTWVSQGSAFTEAFFVGASTDGSKVFFGTYDQLDSGDTDSSIDIYERSGGTTTWVTQGEVNGNGAFDAGFVDASSDGSKVFFGTFEQLVSGDTDSSIDIYERSGGTTTQVSQGGDIGGNGAFGADFVGASGDGTKVFFQTNEQLVSGDTDGSQDVYERSGGTTTWISQGGDIGGNTNFRNADFVGASSDGSKVFFRTSEKLVSGDTDSSHDVYERSGGTTTWVSQGGDIGGNTNFRDADFVGASSDGSKVFFRTSEKLVSGDTDNSQDIYERSGGTTTQVSEGQINGNGAFGADFAGASSDGSKVFFKTDEQLVSGDSDSSTDVYERSAGTTTLIMVDTAPSTTITGGPSGTTNNPTPTFTFSSSEAGSSFECRFDSDPFGPCSGPGDTHTPASALSDGAHTFEVRATDPTGKTDVTPASRSFTVDTAPPDTTIISGPSGATNDPTPTFTFSSSESGSTFECKLDAGSFSFCSSPKTTAHLADGSHTFSVRATDPVGNVDDTPASRTFTVATAEVKVSGSTLVVTAAAGAKDNLQITKPSPSTLRVTDFPSGAYTGSGVHTGAGCTRSGDYTANCNSSGVTLIQVTSADKTDRVVNSTAVKSSLNGGGANDVLTGGSANDTLTGSTGADVFKGMNGNDQLFGRDLTSDTTINCDGGTSPGTADKADLDLLPKDPNSVVVGCETVTRH